MRQDRLWLRIRAAIVVIFTVSVVVISVSATEQQYNNNQANNPFHHVELNENSVVLITGAAGFIGSELAMALYRTYSPKKLICIDSLDAGFGTISSTKSEPDLALFEFKRQRVFHMLQTVDPTKMFFYRVDIRPSIPDYFESSEIPVLHNIFEEHKDITHVIHLADHIHRADENPMQMVIPRVKGQEKAGFQEAIFEELLLQRDIRNETQLSIQYIYASSSEVYNHYTTYHEKADFPNLPPFSESKPLTTPSTAAGAQKLIDEMLAQAYYDAHGLSSIGVRLFNIYGPWGLPRSTIFEMAEYAVSIEGHDPAMAVQDGIENIADWVYIDDAVDAIMSAMQLPIKQAIAINVGTGIGSSTRTIADVMRQIIPGGKNIPASNIPKLKPNRISYADTTRSKEFLGFQPQISLEEGLKKLLAWHYDRTFPYASGVVNKGIAECDIYDTECLKGTPVFPCASECSHASQCKRSLFDDVIALTRAITSKCSTVMYTVALGNNVTQLSSIHVRVSSQSIAYIEDANGSHCNIAFVSESSPLYQRHDMVVADSISMHGFWSLIPVAITKYSIDKIQLLSLLPKLSPGKFFADTVEKAIYCDPDIIFDNLPRLIEESNMQPRHPDVQGATIMLLGRKQMDITSSTIHVTTDQTPPSVLIQDMAYRMIRLAVIDAMTGDGFAQKIDAGFIVHTLRGPDNDSNSYEDGRIFRCDVFGEVIQWQVDNDIAALEFIFGLHDMWSRVMVKKDGIDPWWIGEDVETISSTGVYSGPTHRRRLQEVSTDDTNDEGNDGKAVGDVEDMEQPLVVPPDSNDEEDDEATDPETVAEGADVTGNSQSQLDEHNGFGVVVDAIEAVFGYSKPKQQQRFDRPEDEEADDIIGDDDDNAGVNNPSSRDSKRNADNMDESEDGSPRYYLPNADQDPSSYDVWMGVLSSSSVRFFSRMVSLDAVGVYRVTEDEDGKISTV
jgi:nucleoside-diphosphate-sugar epimerase